MNRSLDIRRLASLIAGPGIDTRVWVSQAVVTAIKVDRQHGVMADVLLVPSGAPETCFVGSPYAGNGFGVWFPLAVDDTVLVAIPMGDSGNGPMIIGRGWDTADVPPTEIDQGDDNHTPINDVYLRVQPGQRLVIRTSNDGDGVDIRVEGNGDITLVPQGSGLVKLGALDGLEPSVLGNTLTQYLNQLHTALQALTLPVSGGTAGPPAPGTIPAPPSITATKVHVK